MFKWSGGPCCSLPAVSGGRGEPGARPAGLSAQVQLVCHRLPRCTQKGREKRLELVQKAGFYFHLFCQKYGKILFDNCLLCGQTFL